MADGRAAAGGGCDATRYAPLPTLTADTVDGLREVWRLGTGDLPAGAAVDKYSPENTPPKVGDNLYVCSAMGIAIALDAATGKERWCYDPRVTPDHIPYGATCRGVAFFARPGAAPDSPCTARIFWGTLDAG